MTIKYRLFCLLILASTLSTSLNAQIQEHYFAEQDVREGGAAFVSAEYKGQIIVGAKTFDKAKSNPNVICYDTTGKVVWQTTTNDTFEYSDGNTIVNKLIIGSDDYIYAAHGNNQNFNEIWKVNPNNGNIVWRKKLPSVQNGWLIDHMIEYGSDRLLFSYKSNYNGSVYEITLTEVDKSNGDILSSNLLGRIPWQKIGYFIQVDDSQNLYYSKEDSLFKLDGIDLSNVLWKQSYPSAKINNFSHSNYHKSSSSLFVFGVLSSSPKLPSFLKINPANGNLVSKHASGSYESSISSIKLKDDYMFMTYRHTFVGSGPKMFITNKYDILNDSILWTSYEQIIKQDKGQAALSIDLDDDGDVYLTGYTGASNYGPAAWAILKLNGNDGTKVFHKIIDEDSTSLDNESFGRSVHIINNQAYFIGTLQDSYLQNTERTSVTFIKLDPASGNILIKKDLARTYQFTSKVFAIEKFQENKVIVFKKVGEAVKLEVYDSLKRLLWERLIRKERSFFLGDIMKTTPTGDIYVAGPSVRKHLYKDIYDNPRIDSMHIIKLNSAGNIVKEYSYRVDEKNKISTVDFVVGNDTIFLLYLKSEDLHFRRLTSTSVSSEMNTKRSYIFIPIQQKLLLDYDQNQDSIVYITEARINFINKKNFISNHFTFPSEHRSITHYVRKDKDHILLMGAEALTSKESVALYNIPNKKVVWSKVWSNNARALALKGILNSTGNYLYTIGNNANEFYVKKIDANTGNEVWTYTYDSTFNLYEFPVDISYNDAKKEILVVGHEGDFKQTEVLILVLDSTGKLVSKITREGDFEGKNAATCAHIWDNGSKWVGGNLNKNPYGLAGFIYDLDPCSINSSSTTTSACRAYTSPSGSYIWTSGGTYYDTLINTGGCDSIITINLTINTINTNVTNTNNTLSANLSGASYQWINCNGNTVISGAISQSYTPTTNGNYAVIVTDNSCSDTSACYSITSLDIKEVIAEGVIRVFPNPSKGIYTLTSSLAFNKATINIYNTAGQLVVSKNNISSNNLILDLTRFSDGIYYVEVTDNSSTRKRLKLIKF